MSTPEPTFRTPPRFGTATWYIFGLLLFAIGCIATFVLVRRMGSTDAYEQERARKRVEARLRIEAEAKERLTRPGWVDPTKNIVRIPLDEAMKQEQAAIQLKTPHPAYAVGAPVPIPPGAIIPSPAAPVPAPTTATATATVATPATPVTAAATVSTPTSTPAPATATATK